MRFVLILLCIFSFVYSSQLKPLVAIEYNKQKALLGKKLFKDTNLSPKSDISCAKCHDIDISYSGVARLSDVGLDKNPNYNKNILYPSVINAGYNYLFYHDASVYRVANQVRKSFESDIEMGSSKEYVEKMLNMNSDYTKWFNAIYNKNPNYEDAIDAIVEFEKALVSLDSKFDKYLRGETKLTKLELDGFKLFKKYACDTCHSGINIGGNIVAKLNDNSYAICSENIVDGYYNTTKNPVDMNYVRVPSLRNVTSRIIHSEDNVFFIDKMIFTMIFCKLGITPKSEEIDKIKAFLYTLQGKRPKILTEELE